MRNLAGTVSDGAGGGVEGVPVQARLAVAVFDALDEEILSFEQATVTDVDGDWTLALLENDVLYLPGADDPGGSYYFVTVGRQEHRAVIPSGVGDLAFVDALIDRMPIPPAASLTVGTLTAGVVDDLSIGITVGAEAADTIRVTFTLETGLGDAVAHAYTLLVWLSDDAGGAVTSVPPDGGWSVGTAGLKVIELAEGGVCALWATSASGVLEIDLEESSAETWYLNAVCGNVQASSPAITFTT